MQATKKVAQATAREIAGILRPRRNACATPVPTIASLKALLKDIEAEDQTLDPLTTVLNVRRGAILMFGLA